MPVLSARRVQSSVIHGAKPSRRPIRGMFKLDRGVENKIMSITGGKPYLIQKVCISLVSRLHEQHRRRITMADVEAVGRPDGA